MPRISLAFFTVAVLCGLAGMGWGSYMGATQHFDMAPAHAHLNLLGWVTLSIMGGFYALTGGPRSKGLGLANFILSSAGVVVMVPMLARLLSGHEKEVGPLMPIPEVAVILGMLCFLGSVILVWRKPAAT
jgi:cbb3-type cytochrome oxidase subunit 1